MAKFQKGLSGNPSGRPKIAPEVRDLAKAYTERAIKTLGDVMANRKASAPARVAAAEALLSRGWGKPLQQLEIRRTPFDEMTPDELRALEAALEDLDGATARVVGGDQGSPGEGEAQRLPAVRQAG